MIGKLKAPRNEEAERQEKIRIDRLVEIAMSMLESAYARHNEAMELGRHPEADEYSGTAAYWWGCLTGKSPS